MRVSLQADEKQYQRGLMSSARTVELYEAQDDLVGQLKQDKILLVESTRKNLEPLREILDVAGFSNIHTTTAGQEAINFLCSIKNQGDNRASLILVDCAVPEIDGYQACRFVRQVEGYASVPIILITNHLGSRTHTVDTGYNVGATDMLFRPFQSLECTSRVMSALSLNRERNLRQQQEHQLQFELAERKAMESRLQYLVYHDDLTGLYNRRMIEQTLKSFIGNTVIEDQNAALLYMDLDQFKVLNDFEGHVEGDRMLVEVSTKLRKIAQQDDVLARISADEFCLLIPNASLEDAHARAELIRKFVESYSFKSNGKTYHFGVSIGIAMLDHSDSASAADVLARGDQACFVAKSKGRNRVHVFSNEDGEMDYMRNYVQWSPLIRHALTHDRFKLVFQPVFDTESGHLHTYEALIRILDNNDLLVSPSEFINVAEQIGLIMDIDRWVVSNALQAVAESNNSIRVNVNLSGRVFQNRGFIHEICMQMTQLHVEPANITFEITETAAMENLEEARETIHFLKSIGCKFALDDFGSGFNSYAYLKELPVDYLKIDGSFIVNAANDPVDQALVKSMIQVGHTLGKKIVAEFVHNEETLSLMKSFGVDFVQGFHLGKPAELPV